MKMNRNFRVRPLAGLIIGAALLPGTAVAAAQAGHVLVASGNVKAVGQDGKARNLTRRAPVYAGDRLLTSSRSRAQVKFTDGAIVALRSSTELSVDEYAYEEGGLQKAFMSLVKGGFRTLSGAIGKSDRANYRVSTPVATIGIRGTLYDANFDPETGLDLAAWNGGIEACSDAGCTNLGSDADYRFGTVGLDGSFQGSDQPPGDGGDDGNPDDEQGDGSQGDGVDAGDDSGNDSDGTPAGQIYIDTNIQEIVGDLGGLGGPDAPVIEQPIRANFPLAGFAVTSSANGPNPWGSQRGIPLDFGRMTGAASGYQLSAIGSVTEDDGYLVSGWTGGSVPCPNPCSFQLQPEQALLGGMGETRLYWGSWISDPGEETVEASLSPDPDLPSAVGVNNSGLYVLGDFASPQVIAGMTGTAHFSMIGMDAFRNGESLPGAADGGGTLVVDMPSGQVAGTLWMSSEDESWSEYWNLAVAGTAGSDRLKLGLLPYYSNAGGSAYGGSYLMRWDVSENIERVGVKGAVDARFIGLHKVDGIAGSFDVYSDEFNSQALRGVFGMGEYDPNRVNYPLAGYMTSAPGSTPNPWPDRILTLNYAEMSYYDPGSWPQWGLTAFGGGLPDGEYVVSGWDDGVNNCSTLCQHPLFPIVWESNPMGEDNTTVYWGAWSGSAGYGGYADAADLSVSTDPYVPSATGVHNPGVYIFGDSASPLVVSQLVGETTFDYFAGVLNTGGMPDVHGTTGWGSMTVDLQSGSASGALHMSSSYSYQDQWNLAFNGSASYNGLELSLTPAGSYLDRGGQSVGFDSKSSLVAGFVGTTQVDGVIGSFDVTTQETSPVNAQGVFLMTLPGGSIGL